MSRKDELLKIASKRGFHDGRNQFPATRPTKYIMRGNKTLEIEASPEETKAYYDSYNEGSYHADLD